MPDRNRTLRSSHREGGFTLIEIVVAMVVFMVAVMGMTALQAASINAASKSRSQTAAVSIARFVITELKSEFAGWDKSHTSSEDFREGEYPLLRQVFVGDTKAVDQWVQYGGAVENDGSFRLDEFLGHNGLADNAGASRFCVNYLLSPIENLEGVAPNAYGDYSVWQIRVRVSWTNEGAFQTDNTAWNVCDPTTVDRRILTDESDDVVELTSMATRELSR